MNEDFTQKLRALEMQFLELGMMVNVAVYRAVQGFTNHDKRLAAEVIAGDQQVNARQMQLEQKCLELIALGKPLASDLRQVVAAMKSSSDLERIGDHAVAIAKVTLRMPDTPRVFGIESQIGAMFAVVRQMQDGVLDAYVHVDAHGARRVAARDHRVNRDKTAIYRASLEWMLQNQDTVELGPDYLQVATYLERIADYATNVCERIVYLQTGEVVELNSSTEDDDF